MSTEIYSLVLLEEGQQLVNQTLGGAMLRNGVHGEVSRNKKVVCTGRIKPENISTQRS